MIADFHSPESCQVGYPREAQEKSFRMSPISTLYLHTAMEHGKSFDYLFCAGRAGLAFGFSSKDFFELLEKVRVWYQREAVEESFPLIPGLSL